MGVVQWGTPCVSCDRVGSAYEENNFIYECIKCKSNHEKNEIKQFIQPLWIRILSWVII